MTPAALTKRVAEIEAAIARLRPPAPGPDLAWLEHISFEELDWLEEVYRAAAVEQRDDLSEADHLRALAIYAGALAKMAGASR
jgi:hypothetical protein